MRRGLHGGFLYRSRFRLGFRFRLGLRLGVPCVGALGVADLAEFAADLASSMMSRIQRREVWAATGLDDAAAYRQLASILTAGIDAGPDARGG